MIKILKDEIKKNKIFTGLAYALCIIMFTGFVFNNVFINALGVLVAACFLISPIHIIPALFCASLFDESLFAFGFTYSRILTLIFLLGALYRIIVDKRKIYLKAVVVCACIFLYCTVSAVLGVTHSLDQVYMLVLNLALVFVMYHLYCGRELQKILSENIFKVFLLIDLFLIIMYLCGKLFNDDGRLSINEQTNVNAFAMALVQMSAFFFASYFINANKFKFIITTVSLIISIGFILLSGSRNALLTLFLGCITVLFTLFFRKNKKKFLIISAAAVISVAVIFMIFYLINPNLAGRFSIVILFEKGGSGRTLIWKTLFTKIIPFNILFGIGFSDLNVKTLVAQYIKYPNGSHNLYIGLLAQLGIVGSSLFIVPFVLIFRKILKHLKENIYMLIPYSMIIFGLFNGIGENVLNVRSLWLALGIGCMILNSEKEQSKFFSKSFNPGEVLFSCINKIKGAGGSIPKESIPQRSTHGESTPEKNTPEN